MAADFESQAGWRYRNEISQNSHGRGRGARKFANQERFGSFNYSQPSFGSGFENFGNGPPSQSIAYPTNEFEDQHNFERNYTPEAVVVSRNGDSGQSKYIEETYSVENSLVPRIIGKQGATIKQLQNESSCRINVDRDSKTETHTDITLKGDENQLMQLKIRLEKRFGGNFGADHSAEIPNQGFNSFESQRNQSGFRNNSFVEDGNSNFHSGTGFNRRFNQSRNSFGQSDDSNRNNFKSTFNEDSARKFSEFSNGTPNNESNRNFSSGFGGNQEFVSSFGQPCQGAQFGSNQSDSPQSFSRNLHHSREDSGRSFVSNAFRQSRRSENSFGGNRRNDDDFSVFSACTNRSQRVQETSSFGFSSFNSQRNQNQTDQSASSTGGEGGYDWGPNTAAKVKAMNDAIDDAAAAVPKIDWDAVRSCKPEARFKDYPAITKDFYFEHPVVAGRSEAEVKDIRKSKNDIVIKDMSKTGDRRCPNPVTTFEEAFEKYPEILDTIYDQGFEQPSPIQCQGWPVLLKGNDLIGIAQTGSGKTLAFLLPALIHIDLQPVPRDARGGPNVLVMCPTRELALQIETEVKKYHYKGIKSVCVYGGGDRSKQVSICTEGVEIVIATPGRLYDLISAGVISIMSVTYVVLDEADRMLDMGFEPQILKCMLDVRPDRQTVMTSATWNWDVQRIAAKYLTDPFFVNVGSLDLTAVHSVTQQIIFAEEEEKDALLYEMIGQMKPDDKMIVFIGKKLVVDQLSSKFAMGEMAVESIHGGREQCAREDAINAFRDSEVRVLLATDVASRGLDILDVTLVVNYDFPKNMEEYVHRVGRTGRAGRTGLAVSFISRRDWGNSRELIRILEEAEQIVPDELRDMANRFDRMKERRAAEGGGGFGGRRGGGGGFGGRGGGGRGFGGNRRNRDRDDDFGGLSMSSSAFMPG